MMTTLPRLLLALSVCLALPAADSRTARAQTDSSTATSSSTSASVDAGAVTMSVTVFDKHGDLVPNLTKDDFTLTADGRPQAIQSFLSAAHQPLTLGLVVETSGGQGRTLEAERAATKAFFDQMLTGPGDRGFLIQYAGEVDLLADATPEKSKLDAALGKLGAPQSHNTASDAQEGSGSGSPHLEGAGATLYDAIYLASTELMKKQPGRKALIVLSDGVDRGSKESLFSTIEAAQRANTAVYAIYFKGEKQRENSNGFPGQRRGRTGYPGGYPGGGGRYPGGYPGGYPGSGGGWPGNGGGGQPGRSTEGTRIDGRKVLAQICRETGGGSFETSGKHPVDQIYSGIASQLRGQYVLSFTPDSKSSYGGFHRITLTMKDKALYAQTRQGYYTGE